ncbi:LanC-like protein 1, partial [Tetrabaena socialis]
MAVSPDGPAAAHSPKALVHWCHGAPGAVLLWCKAHEVLGDVSYLEAAERAGEVVWQLGLLRKGHGLCHGTSGNAYALLALHRATAGQQPRWLHRAAQFAAHVSSEEGRSVLDTPDRPLSLYEGRAGVLCLLADLLGGAEGARFPAFELPPPP